MIKADSRQASRNFLTSETGSERNQLLEFYILENEINLRVIYPSWRKEMRFDGGLNNRLRHGEHLFYTGVNFILKQINENDVSLYVLNKSISNLPQFFFLSSWNVFLISGFFWNPNFLSSLLFMILH